MDPKVLIVAGPYVERVRLGVLTVQQFTDAMSYAYHAGALSAHDKVVDTADHYRRQLAALTEQHERSRRAAPLP